MSNSLLVKSGTIINHDGIEKADILIDHGKIIDIASVINPSSKTTEIIDAHSKYIIPGGIDPHVHFALKTASGKTADNFYSGSLSALAGGTTTIIDFVTPEKNETLGDAFFKRKQEAESCLVDYALHGSVTTWHDNSFADLKNCVEKTGITSLKVYMAYTDSIGLHKRDIEKVMFAAARLNLTVLVHCEDDMIVKNNQQKLIKEGKTGAFYHHLSRPAEAEINAIKEVISLAQKTSCIVYIVHVSTPEGAQLIREANAEGVKVFSETCIQYLILDNSLYNNTELCNNYILSPPLRSPAQKDILFKQLSENTFDVISSDHCPFNSSQKSNSEIMNFLQIPNGIAGVENRLSLLFHHGVIRNKIGLTDFVNLTSTNAAKIFGLYPQKGYIGKGSDADIIIFNPQDKHILQKEKMKLAADYCVYDGMEAAVIPEILIIKGQIVIKRGVFNIKNLKGKYLRK
ncbi:MAG: dihydropyrimidinase [Bacteroidales bacterium]|nr:dihydropyrimidinase [Bacteroidales bacterium]